MNASMSQDHVIQEWSVAILLETSLVASVLKASVVMALALMDVLVCFLLFFFSFLHLSNVITARIDFLILILITAFCLPTSCYPSVICTDLEGGGFVCGACPSGFSGNGFTCIGLLYFKFSTLPLLIINFHLSDIDECTNATLNNCNINGKCHNFDGGFNCSCNNGFTGNGVTCTGKILILL